MGDRLGMLAIFILLLASIAALLLYRRRHQGAPDGDDDGGGFEDLALGADASTPQTGTLRVVRTQRHVAFRDRAAVAAVHPLREGDAGVGPGIRHREFVSRWLIDVPRGVDAIDAAERLRQHGQRCPAKKRA